MVGILYDIILAIIQGVTEFLPVSSSGHLVLAQAFFGLDSPGATLEIALHLGTLGSILVFYWRDLGKLFRGEGLDSYAGDRNAWRSLLLLVVASIPAAIVGIGFESFMESLFDRADLASAMLILTGVVLVATRLLEGIVSFGREDKRIGFLDALVMGLAQALAIIPGISRSGFTISAGRLVGISGEDSARFSFFMAIIAIGGAAFIKIISGPVEISPGLFIGMIISGIVGYFCLYILLKVIQFRKMWIFGPYCALLGVLGLILL